MDLMDRLQSVENLKEMFEVNCMLSNFSFYCSGEKKSTHKLNNFFVRIKETQITVRGEGFGFYSPE